MRDAKLDKSSIHDIVLVGGSTRYNFFHVDFCANLLNLFLADVPYFWLQKHVFLVAEILLANVNLKKDKYER